VANGRPRAEPDRVAARREGTEGAE
jgi:hypothetical protein